MGITGIKNRLLEALKLDSTIVYDRNNLEEAEGHPVEYYEKLGLSKSDLRTLAKHGFAIRGYLPSKSGHRVRWLLLSDRGEHGSATGTDSGADQLPDVQATVHTDQEKG